MAITSFPLQKINYINLNVMTKYPWKENSNLIEKGSLEWKLTNDSITCINVIS